MCAGNTDDEDVDAVMMRMRVMMGMVARVMMMSLFMSQRFISLRCRIEF